MLSIAYMPFLPTNPEPEILKSYLPPEIVTLSIAYICLWLTYLQPEINMLSIAYMPFALKTRNNHVKYCLHAFLTYQPWTLNQKSYLPPEIVTLSIACICLWLSYLQPEINMFSIAYMPFALKTWNIMLSIAYMPFLPTNPEPWTRNPTYNPK